MNLTGSPNYLARIVLNGDPGSGCSSNQYKQFNTAAFSGPTYHSIGAESGANPNVRTYWDALHYIATSLSVGYANVFPVTALGKAIGAIVMTVGPALSARALDHVPRAGEDGGGTALLGDKLDAILAELRRIRGA